MANFGSNREIRERGLLVDQWSFGQGVTIKVYEKQQLIKDPGFILENGWLVALPNGTKVRLVEVTYANQQYDNTDIALSSSSVDCPSDDSSVARLAQHEDSMPTIGSPLLYWPD